MQSEANIAILPPAAPLVPFVTDIAIRGFFGRATGERHLTLTFHDQRGRTMARSLCSLDDVERHAHALLAAVAATRAADPAVVPIGFMPRANSPLMHDLHTGDAA